MTDTVEVSERDEVVEVGRRHSLGIFEKLDSRLLAASSCHEPVGGAAIVEASAVVVVGLSRAEGDECEPLLFIKDTGGFQEVMRY
jgi:hypothetical protein